MPLFRIIVKQAEDSKSNEVSFSLDTAKNILHDLIVAQKELE